MQNCGTEENKRARILARIPACIQCGRSPTHTKFSERRAKKPNSQSFLFQLPKRSHVDFVLSKYSVKKDFKTLELLSEVIELCPGRFLREKIRFQSIPSVKSA